MGLKRATRRFGGIGAWHSGRDAMMWRKEGRCRIVKWGVSFFLYISLAYWVFFKLLCSIRICKLLYDIS